MGIGSVTSTSGMSGMQMLTTGSSDPKIKKFQTEITSAQQQMQKLSSKEELSANEKTNEREKLKKEISSLNTELKRHQDELRRSQKREAMMAELQEDGKLAKEEKTENKIQAEETSINQAEEKKQPDTRQQREGQGTVVFKNEDGTVILKDSQNQTGTPGIDTENKQTDEAKDDGTDERSANAVNEDKAEAAGLSGKEIHAMISADASVQQAGRQGVVISKARGDISVMAGEIRQDERRNVNTETKQAELERMERKEQRATAFQSSVLGEATDAMQSAVKPVTGIKDTTQANAENGVINNAFINAFNASQAQGQAAQQRFFVSLGH